MRLKMVFALSLLTAAPLMAQEKASAPALPQGLEDKFKGTRMIVDMLKGDSRIKPHRVCIDHVEERRGVDAASGDAPREGHGRRPASGHTSTTERARRATFALLALGFGASLFVGDTPGEIGTATAVVKPTATPAVEPAAAQDARHREEPGQARAQLHQGTVAVPGRGVAAQAADEEPDAAFAVREQEPPGRQALAALVSSAAYPFVSGCTGA